MRSSRTSRIKGLRVNKLFERRNQMKTIVTIGIEAGAFSITVEGRRYHIDQEDDPSIELTKLFESLGYHVDISEVY